MGDTKYWLVGKILYIVKTEEVEPDGRKLVPYGKCHKFYDIKVLSIDRMIYNAK